MCHCHDRERRIIRPTMLRTETKGDKQYLTGYAATYGTISAALDFGIRERIKAGAFTRALREGQDVRHLINHDANLVLGRTRSGTTELSEDSKGLFFKTLLPDTSYAADLAESVARGDISECSFGFAVHGRDGERWVEGYDGEEFNALDPDDPRCDPDDPDYDEDADCPDDDDIFSLRELLDVDLFDVSTVTYPAYSNTVTELNSRFHSRRPARRRLRELELTHRV